MVDDLRLGRIARALRHRRGWRQSDVAAASQLSQDAISRIERGRIAALPLAKLRRAAAALDADIRVTLHWRGGELDRLIDEGHAHLVGRTVELLKGIGWHVRTEVSFSIFGERGSIDVLAWHASTRTLLVVEIKTELTTVEETIRRHGAKARLGPQIAAEQLGWRAASVGRLLVLPDLSTPRRRVERHAPVLAAAYPDRGIALRKWLGEPDRAASGLMFIRSDRGRTAGPIGRKRIRCRGAG